MTGGFTVIAAVDMKNNAIGKNGAMYWRSRLEMSWFKHVTKNAIVAMGRTTFDSIRSPLEGRTTVVFTRDVQGFILQCSMRGL